MNKVKKITYRILNHYISKPENKIHVVMRLLLGNRLYYRLICKAVLMPIGNEYVGNKALLPTSKVVILLFNGKIYNTGLADRLRAITSIYHFCKQNDLCFKMAFTSPFHLEDYLIPNKYDWAIEETELSYDKKCSYPLAVISFARIFGEETNVKMQMEQLERIKQIDANQIHLYANCFCYDDYFCDDFNQLFRLSNGLERLINNYLKELGNSYVSASFRFTQLLGDLTDTFGLPLNENGRNVLINKCLDGLQKVYNKHKRGRILVTSDSVTFIREASKLPFVYIVPGRVGHIAQSDDKSVAERTFVDMFLISKAKKAYMLRTKEMFRSGFARRGAMIGNVLFEEIVLE